MPGTRPASLLSPGRKPRVSGKTTVAFLHLRVGQRPDGHLYFEIRKTKWQTKNRPRTANAFPSQRFT